MTKPPTSPRTKAPTRPRLTPTRLRCWWQRHKVTYRYHIQFVPLDEDNTQAGGYPSEHYVLQWHERTTTWRVEQRKTQEPPRITWNSEHLAYWFGERTSQSGRQSDGQDVDLDIYTFESDWLGTHTYTN